MGEKKNIFLFRKKNVYFKLQKKTQMNKISNVHGEQPSLIDFLATQRTLCQVCQAVCARHMTTAGHTLQ